MGRIPDVKRIRQEDFPSDQQEMVGKLGYSINTFMDQVVSLFTGNIDFINLNQEIKTVTVRVDGSGNLVSTPKIQTSIRTSPAGILCISARNKNNTGVYPDGQPFVSWTINSLNNSVINVLNVSGLQNNSEYVLTLLILGS